MNTIAEKPTRTSRGTASLAKLSIPSSKVSTTLRAGHLPRARPARNASSVSVRQPPPCSDATCSANRVGDTHRGGGPPAIEWYARMGTKPVEPASAPGVVTRSPPAGPAWPPCRTQSARGTAGCADSARHRSRYARCPFAPRACRSDGSPRIRSSAAHSPASSRNRSPASVLGHELRRPAQVTRDHGRPLGECLNHDDGAHFVAD